MFLILCVNKSNTKTPHSDLLCGETKTKSGVNFILLWINVAKVNSSSLRGRFFTLLESTLSNHTDSKRLSFNQAHRTSMEICICRPQEDLRSLHLAQRPPRCSPRAVARTRNFVQLWCVRPRLRSQLQTQSPRHQTLWCLQTLFSIFYTVRTTATTVSAPCTSYGISD